ncbi:dihydrodipicolinate reductase [Tabrizicola sp.]|uniref:dihydrodipicolinate reductase n=1 Tax=Tabrizicola sp. TaxID=2005166 RepID=UPI002733F075|nr:dihydrodipicolinate reductase [Tabrizicola sp.]MDP3195981.1 dihydrodipicolinate reductase [Tabrizicola sp.]
MLRLCIALMFALPSAAAAEGFTPVKDKNRFLDIVQDRELRIGLYNLSLNVLPDGRIDGSALGWKITGNWSWKDGYFCREMDWSGTPISYNCQLVEADGVQKLRFTVDQGKGDSATFRLR